MKRVGVGAAALAAAVTAGTVVYTQTHHRPVTRSIPIDMLNPSVSPQTEGKTICVQGWTATIRPPVGYTERLKTHQIGTYGYADSSLSAYEEDHAIPLELGGSPSAPANLWPEPHSVSFSDDRKENALRQQVCAHSLTLDAARQQIYQLKVSHGYRREASVK